MSVRIVPVRTVADIDDVRGLFIAYASALPIDLSYQRFDQELADLPGAYGPPHGELLIARDDAKTAIGCIGVRPLAVEGCGELKRLYVSPNARGLGLGIKLIDAIVRAAARLGYRELRLDTLSSMGPAIRLYEAAGFQRIAPYYETPVPDTLFFAKKL